MGNLSYCMETKAGSTDGLTNGKMLYINIVIFKQCLWCLLTWISDTHKEYLLRISCKSHTKIQHGIKVN